MTRHTARIRVIGVPWFRRVDYPQAREAMDDASLLPASYDVGQDAARAVLRRLLDRETLVVLARIHLKGFIDWCRERDLTRNAAGRMAYARWVAARDAAHVVAEDE